MLRCAVLLIALAGALPLPAHAQAAADAGIAKATGGAKVDQCAKCHAEQGPARLRAVEFAKDVHGKRSLTCASCHGGDATATTAEAAHAKGFTALPKDHNAVTGMCGKCHTAPAENWSNGPHRLAKDAAKKPDCVTCHGGHGVAPANIDLIAEPLCSRCHSIDQARRIHKAVAGVEKEIATLDGELARVGGQGEFQAKLHAERTKLRGLTHRLDLLAVTRTAAEAEALVDEVRAKALPLVGAREWAKEIKRSALIGAAVLALLAAALVARWVWRRRHLLPKVPMPRTGPMMALAGVGVLIAAAAVVGGVRGFNYMEHDPKFCTSCHTMGSAYDLWQKSAHNKIECHACHIADPVANLHQLFVYTTERPDKVVKHAEIDRSICEKCHTQGSNASKWNNIAETPGHKLHTGKNRVECVQCHAMSAHRFKPPQDFCVTCHKAITLKAAGTMSEMHCLQCHNFTAVSASQTPRPDRAVCLDCHEQRKIKGETFPEKAPMKWDCGKCHKPHEKMIIANADCAKCHLGVDEGIHKVKAHANCLDCHKPHGWNTERAACVACHTGREKHNPGKNCGTCHGSSDP